MKGKLKQKHARARRKTRIVISMGLCLLMTAAVALFLSVAALLAGYGSRDLFLESVSSMPYYEEVAENLARDIVARLERLALPQDLADGIVDAEEVYVEGTRYVRDILDGGESVPDSARMQKKLRKNINGYLSNYDIPKNDDLDAQVEALLSDVAEAYEREMTFHAAELYRRQHARLHTKARRILVACAVCIVLPMSILWFMYYRRYHALRYLDHAVLGGTITAGILHVHASRRLQSMQVLAEGDGYGRMMGEFFREASVRGWFFPLIGICAWLALLLATKELREKRM